MGRPRKRPKTDAECPTGRSMSDNAPQDAEFANRRDQLFALCDAGRFMAAEQELFALARLDCAGRFGRIHWDLESRRTDARMAMLCADALLKEAGERDAVLESVFDVYVRYGASDRCAQLLERFPHRLDTLLGSEGWRHRAWIALCDGDSPACRRALRQWVSLSPMDARRCRRALDYVRVLGLGEVSSELDELEAMAFCLECPLDLLLYGAVLAHPINASERVYDQLEGLRGATSNGEAAWRLARSLLAHQLGRWDTVGEAVEELEHKGPDTVLARRMTDECRVRAGRGSRRAVAPSVPACTRAVAILLSGCVRTYTCGVALDQLRRRFPQARIDVFAHAFDRLGDLRIPAGLPEDRYDYIHGGYERELAKTAPLDHERLVAILRPTRFLLQPRASDAEYLARHGTAHPQWVALRQAFALAERYSEETGTHYDLVMRARYDHDLSRTPLDRVPLTPGTVYTPTNLAFGHPAHRMNDREALGAWETMQIYAALGEGCHYAAMEADAAWQGPLARFGASHETHLGYWLASHGLTVVALPGFESVPVDLD